MASLARHADGLAGHRALFATASEWIDRLAAAHHNATLQQELLKLGR